MTQYYNMGSFPIVQPRGFRAAKNFNFLSARSINRVMKEAIEKKISEVEIIPGKGSGQLKKRVLRYLEQKQIKALYHRIEKDSKNFGRIFVHFKY